MNLHETNRAASPEYIPVWYWRSICKATLPLTTHRGVIIHGTSYQIIRSIQHDASPSLAQSQGIGRVLKHRLRYKYIVSEFRGGNAMKQTSQYIRHSRFALGVQNQSDNKPGTYQLAQSVLLSIKHYSSIPIETQNFTEDEYKDHSHVNTRLLHVCPYTL